MKNLVCVIFIITLITSKVMSGQSIGKFDIVTYSEPPGWVMETGNGFVAYTINNDIKNEYARILIFKSLQGMGNIDADFATEWKELVQLNYQPGNFTKTNVSDYKDGWVSKIGVAPFKYKDATHAALLLTLIKSQTIMSFVFITNTTSYQTVFEDFASSLHFGGNAYSSDNMEFSTGSNKIESAPANITPPINQAISASSYDQRLIGKWNRSGASHPHYADASSWGTAGYTTSRYEFKADGIYIYTERSFRLTHANIILVKENGQFKVSNNLITITPEKSLIESYTKKNDVDELGTLVKSENRKLEVVTYTFTFHYFSGIQEWNLVLQAPNPTNRDGNFSRNDTYSNAWYFDQKYIDNDLTSPKGN